MFHLFPKFNKKHVAESYYTDLCKRSTFSIVSEDLNAIKLFKMHDWTLAIFNLQKFGKDVWMCFLMRGRERELLGLMAKVWVAWAVLNIQIVCLFSFKPKP